ncbi:BatD family protein [Pseudomonas sp. DC3000-4b1]|uniref:BatD family protein n=1 Tax=unclassified Pseudomonas TaxID=196821 RepID=UPI003CF60D24
MSRLYAFLLCVLALALPLPTVAAVLVASVDRAHLAVGESFELSLETGDATLFGRPDTAPLEADFRVGDVRQVNRPASIADDRAASTRWIVSLVPLGSGTLTIPALQVGDLRSQPIVVQVLDAPTATPASTAPVFIEASLDQERVYVQAQTILTLRAYHSVALYDDSLFTPPELSDARVEPLGPRRAYEKVIDGVRHGVIETRYALYPQRSGELVLPPLMFTATTVASDDNGRPRPGAQVRVASASLSLKVLPKPGVYPADAAWLPARGLSLSETWNPAPETASVGESLTRTLTLKAEGLSSAQLPPLPDGAVDAMRRYPDQPRLDDQHTERGLVGSRQEREALVPSRPGRSELPAVDIVWWNTREDHLEHTSLPARAFEVQPAAEPTGVTSLPGPAVPGPLWPWQLATALLSLTTLLGFGLWWRARSRPAVARLAAAGPSSRGLLDDLKRACLNNDPQSSRQALDAWARQQSETLAQMAVRHPPLSDALDGLNGALYSEAGRYWQGRRLWQAVSSLPNGGRPAGAEESLPPLYPK